MSNAVKPVPDGYQTVTPYLCVEDADAAMAFYTKAFGAQELHRMPAPDGRVAHAEMLIGSSRVMMSDPFPEMGAIPPGKTGGSPIGLFLYVPDVDAWFRRAIAAGAKETMPVADMFWGDRFGKLKDPFGIEWQMATHIEDVAPEEMMKRAAAAMG
jgi:PhnB protein